MRAFKPLKGPFLATAINVFSLFLYRSIVNKRKDRLSYPDWPLTFTHNSMRTWDMNKAYYMTYKRFETMNPVRGRFKVQVHDQIFFAKDCMPCNRLCRNCNYYWSIFRRCLSFNKGLPLQSHRNMSTKTARRAKCGTETLLVGTQPYNKRGEHNRVTE